MILRPRWWLTADEVDDVVWGSIPPKTGTTAVEISERTRIRLGRVRRSLDRQMRRGQVSRVGLEVPGREVAWEWHAVEQVDERQVEDELFAIMLMNPYGITADELAKTADYSSDVTGAGLARLEDAHRVKGESCGGERVWLIVMPEDGDQ
jgi:hypothetical protein